jgi:ABC-2 type transport system ATP-binding protein
VSFSIARGEVFGLLGPNGAGKTTLIRILLDIVRADQGTVHLFGEPLTRAHLDRVGYLPEERGLYKKQKIVDVLSYFGRLHGLSRGEARERSLHWLDRVGLPHVARWSVGRLSKGMSQKVQVAGTLLFDPELCVLDEPFTGLDPVNVRLVQDLIEERRAAGLTTVLSTHRMTAVEELCDRVALIDHGRLMVYGRTDTVRSEHSDPEVRVRLAGALPALSEIAGSSAAGDGVWRLRLAPEVTVDGLVAALVASGAGVQSVEPVMASMQDVFVRVVQQKQPVPEVNS